MFKISILVMILIFMSLGVVTPSGAVIPANMKLEIEWEAFFGGSGDDIALDLIQTVDGGFACLTRDIEGDASVVKFTASGQQEWSSTFWDVSLYLSNYLVQTSDEGFIILDRWDMYGGENVSIFLAKMTSTGLFDWNLSFGGVEDNYDWAMSITPTIDGGFALAGATNKYASTDGDYDMLLVKTDELCVPEWNCTFGKNEFDIAKSVIQTTDGGYALAGRYGLGGHDMWLVKTDSNGQHEWNQTFGGLMDDIAASVIQLADGSFLLAGETDSFASGGTDFWLVKTDSTGQHVWNMTYGTPQEEEFKSLIQTIDGGFLLVGNTYSYDTANDILVVKTNANGIQEWNATLHKSNADQISSVIQLSDNQFVIAGATYPPGKTNTDMWLLKVQVVEDTATTTTTTVTTTTTATTTTTTVTSGTPGFELGVLILNLSLLFLILRKRRQ